MKDNRYDELLKGSNLNKTPLNIYQKNTEDKYFSRPMSTGFGRNTRMDKENILRRAEEEAARKIEEIERKARMKVMEKRSGLGQAYWMK